MSDALSSAELTDQSVELLPARTVLSLIHTVAEGDVGVAGEAGTRGASGASIPGTTMWAAFGYSEPSNAGSTTVTSYGIGNATSTTTR